jgi:hypothetical protein
MPRGPKGEKRPARVIGGAVTVARISVGEIAEPLTTPSGKYGADTLAQRRVQRKCLLRRGRRSPGRRRQGAGNEG